MIALAAFVATFALMEGWAAALHRFAWHGPMWFVHQSHHQGTAVRRDDGRWEWNDLLALSHAPPSMALIAWGVFGSGSWAAPALGAGVGMTLFGACYVLIHDGFVHERLPLRTLRRWAPFERIRRAHLIHHAHNAAPYGLFWPVLTGDRRWVDAPTE